MPSPVPHKRPVCRFSILLLAALVGSLISTGAEAHIGTGTAFGGGFGAGFTHPLSGLDHLLAMLAVGIWAGSVGGRFAWLGPLSFLAMMAVGGALGIAHVHVPQVENSIAGSVAAFGLVLALAWKPAPAVGMAVTGLFALFHGHAHGTEMGETASPVLYALGFVAATGLLHMTGIGIAALLRRAGQTPALRWIGTGMMAAGAVLFIV